MKFLPTTIKGWNAKKRLFMRLWTKEPDPEQAEVYEHAINYCDRKVGQVYKVSRMLIVVLACLLLALGGCIENTMRGAGKMIWGAGELVTGVGKDVVRGTDGYSNER